MCNTSAQISSMAFIHMGTKHLNKRVFWELLIKDEGFNTDFVCQNLSHSKLQRAQVRVTLESSAQRPQWAHLRLDRFPIIFRQP